MVVIGEAAESAETNVATESAPCVFSFASQPLGNGGGL